MKVYQPGMPKARVATPVALLPRFWSYLSSAFCTSQIPVMVLGTA